MTAVQFLVTVEMYDHPISRETPRADAAGFIPQLVDAIESYDMCEVINIEVGEIEHEHQ